MSSRANMVSSMSYTSPENDQEINCSISSKTFASLLYPTDSAYCRLIVNEGLLQKNANLPDKAAI